VNGITAVFPVQKLLQNFLICSIFTAGYPPPT